MSRKFCIPALTEKTKKSLPNCSVCNVCCTDEFKVVGGKAYCLICAPKEGKDGR